MSSIDDRFREGLGDRKPDVPQDLWAKIAARKAAIPEGEAIDHLFADKLTQRQAAVPAGMWARITAARRPAPYRTYAALFLLLLAGGLAYFLWPGTQVPGTPTGANEITAASTPAEKEGDVFPAAEAAFPTELAGAPLAAAGGELSPANSLVRSGSVDQSRTPAVRPPAVVAEPPALSDRARPALLATVAALPVPYPTSLNTALLPGLPVAEAVPFRSTRRRFGVEALLGAAYAHQSFGGSSESSRLLRDAREVSEFPTVSVQLSVRLRYRISDRFRVLSGLTYVGIRNQFEYENVGATQRMSLQRTTNRLQLLEVPLLASYELPGRRLRLNVNAGPVINLATRVRGKYINPDFAQPQALEDGDDYRSNIGVGWTASLTTTYFLGKERTTQLLLEPFFKHYPGSFTRPGAALSEKYWVAGLQLGLRKPLR